MNADMTAPPVVERRNQSLGSLSDETTRTLPSPVARLDVDAAALTHHVRRAISFLRLGTCVAGGWQRANQGVFLSRNMTATTIASAGALLVDRSFARLTGVTPAQILATEKGDLTSITTTPRRNEGRHETAAGEAAAADGPSPTILERLSQALAEWKGLLAPDHFDAMKFHVDRLVSDQGELDEDEITPSPSSFDDLLAFLASRPWSRAPAVGLSRNGQFSASWGRSQPAKSDVTLTFRGDGSVKWYVFGLGKRHMGSAAGTSERLDLPRILVGLKCDDWMIR